MLQNKGRRHNNNFNLNILKLTFSLFNIIFIYTVKNVYLKFIRRCNHGSNHSLKFFFF